LTLTYPDAYNIVSFDKLDYCSSLNNTRVLNDKRNFSFYHGDITNPSEVMDCLERHKIDTIFHFAAQSHVDLSFGNSYAFTHTNVYGTHVLLESAKKVGIKKFIHISTDEVYGEVRDDADDLLETSILAPTNPYAASKAAAEMLVHSYQKSFKLPVIIVRSNNVYGPHQYPESETSNPLLELELLISCQKSFPNLACFSIGDSQLSCTVTELPRGDTSLLVTQPMRSTQFFTRAQWIKFTMLDLTTRFQI
jgi:dTDP-D-glucose 4,6-dehydratase